MLNFRNTSKYSFVIFAIVFSTQISFSQSRFPRGGYVDLPELKSGQPSIPFAFEIKKRTLMGKILWGGSDYKIVSTSNQVSRSFIRSKINAISTGDSLYINLKKQRIGYWYSLVQPDGNTIYFKYGALYAKDLSTGEITKLTKVNMYDLLEGEQSVLKSYESEKNKSSEETLKKYYKLVHK